METSSQNPNQPSPQRILEMAWGFAPPLILQAAIEHRVFDVLDAGPRTLAEVAGATSASERGLRALMNALVAFQFLRRDGDRYALTPESSAFLVSTKPSFQGGLLRHTAGSLIPQWLKLTETVRTGQPSRFVNHEDQGGEFFAKFVEDLFAMNYPGARALAESLAQKLAADSKPKVLDLAAGSGVWGIALAQKSPNVSVTAVDWPAVTPVAQRIAAKHGIGDRYRTIDGDLHTADFGGGYAVATLGHILHSEGEAESRKLLDKVFTSLAPGGTIVIAEFVANDDRQGPPQALVFAINMLVNTTHGDTFTFAEMTSWLKESGFQNIRQLPVPGPSPLLLADRPK